MSNEANGTNETNKANPLDLSRRNLLKLTVAWLLAGIAAPVLTPLSAAHAAERGAGGNKILIAYFSHSGNTREIANQIHKRVGGDIFEIQAIQSYPLDYDAVVAQAKQEQQAGARPKLKTRVKNIGSYQTVFVGYPNWWGTMPMPLFTFLAEYHFSGKTIVPFCTHEGSSLGESVEDLKELCPQSTVLEGLAVRGRDVRKAQNEVSRWLRKIGMVK